MDSELKELYDDIVHCLVRYGGLKEEEAQQQIDEFGLFDEIETEEARNSLLHEMGYYWAMNILYAQDDPYWHLNPDLWPPPNSYFE